jgi:hypothetical protein
MTGKLPLDPVCGVLFNCSNTHIRHGFLGVMMAMQGLVSI